MYIWQLKIHGNPRGQANEPLNNALSSKKITVNKAKKTLSNVTGSAKKGMEFMESYNYSVQASVISVILISLLWNGCFHRETNQKFQFLPQSNVFFYLPFADNEKNPASFLDMG